MAQGFEEWRQTNTRLLAYGMVLSIAASSTQVPTSNAQRQGAKVGAGAHFGPQEMGLSENVGLIFPIK